MARTRLPKNPSRFRFIMIDAELGDGDIAHITQAVQNALRPPTAPVPKRLASTVINGSAASASVRSRRA
jgi:hypothetical protein